MEPSCSSLHLLAEVACDVRKIEMQLTQIPLQNQKQSRKGNSNRFGMRKEENSINNGASEVSFSKQRLKRKVLSHPEGENQKTKKHRNNVSQSVLISKSKLVPPCKTKISVSGLKVKFHNVCQKTTSVVSKHGILMDFHKNHISWKGKRKRSLKGRTANEVVLKGSRMSWERTEDIGYQPELPLQFRTKIQELNGSKLKLVIQKQLRASDVNPSNSCFSIPGSQIQNEFLEETEKHLLDKRAEKGQKLLGLDVMVLGPRLGQFNLHLKKWKMETNIIYNLTHKWNKVRVKNGLEEKDLVQLWSFRRQDQLCFALVKL